MRLLLVILLLFAVGAASAYYLRVENGYVLLSFGHWMVETSVVGFAFAVLLAVVGLMLLFRAILSSWRLPATVREAFSRRRARREHDALVEGVLLWLAGRDERAEVLLQKHLPESRDAAAHHLVSALAALRLQQYDRARHYLDRCQEQEHPLAIEAVTLLKAQRADTEPQALEARQALEALRDRSPSHPRVYPALAENLLATGEWRAALDLLRSTEKSRGWAPGQWQQAALRALQGALEEAMRIEDAKTVWSQAPRSLAQVPEAVHAYARSLLRLNAEKEGMAVIHQTLERRWAPEMVRLFLSAEPPDDVAALASVEQWLQRHGEQAELLLAAAQTCRRSRLWGKARSYLDALLAQAPSAEAHYEYGLLCEASQQPQEAVRHFREATRRSLQSQAAALLPPARPAAAQMLPAASAPLAGKTSPPVASATVDPAAS